jgi:hypothetical protein
MKNSERRVRILFYISLHGAGILPYYVFLPENNNLARLHISLGVEYLSKSTTGVSRLSNTIMKFPSFFLLGLFFPKELFSFSQASFLHRRISKASEPTSSTTSVHLSTEETKKIVFDEKQRPSIGASRRGAFRPKKNNGHYANQIFKLKDGHLLQYNEYYVDGSSDLVVCELQRPKAFLFRRRMPV